MFRPSRSALELGILASPSTHQAQLNAKGAGRGKRVAKSQSYMTEVCANGHRNKFFWLYQALPGLTGPDRPNASPGLRAGRRGVRRSVGAWERVVYSCWLSHCGFAERT